LRFGTNESFDSHPHVAIRSRLAFGPSWRWLSYAVAVQLELPFLRPDAIERSVPPRAPATDFVRVRRARKYIIRVRPDGSIRVTIPRGGSRREAESFLARHRKWAEQERLRVAACHAPVEWYEGQTILLRGEPVALRVEVRGRSRMLVVGDQRVRLPAEAIDLRPAAEVALRHLAGRELIPRLKEFADRHGLSVSRALVRGQRSRWGSCSRAGAIALNFRLVQMPPAVRDYVLLHELMHLRQQNHSRRYWRLVEEVCPDFRDAERWLRVEGRSLF
jgi:predicted metal-dependent hydrolase